jgi:hypothetical protein
MNPVWNKLFHRWEISDPNNAAMRIPVQMDKANERQVGGEHYRTDGPQHWDLCVALKLDYFQGQITKYVCRWKEKGGLQDLEKAKHFLEKYIENYTHFASKEPLKEKVPKDLYAYEVIKDIEAQFLPEGYFGTMETLYTCRRCGAKITASNPIVAWETHGECAGRGYVKQD